MKNFLQNLLIVFALGLCGLMAYQWVRETGLRKQIQELTDKLHDRDEAIQALQGTVKRTEAEIQRLDALRIDLNNTIKTNQAKIVELTKNLEKTQNDLEKEQQQVIVFKEALGDRQPEYHKTKRRY